MSCALVQFNPSAILTPAGNVVSGYDLANCPRRAGAVRAGCYDRRMVGRRIILSSALLLLLLFGGAASAADDPARGRVGGIDFAEGEVAIRLPASGRAAGDSRSGRGPRGVVRSRPQRPGRFRHGGAHRNGGARGAAGRRRSDRFFRGRRPTSSSSTMPGRRSRCAAAARGAASEPDSGSDVEITIPSGALRLSAPGEYDILAGDGNPRHGAVLAGKARFSGRGPIPSSRAAARRC